MAGKITGCLHHSKSWLLYAELARFGGRVEAVDEGLRAGRLAIVSALTSRYYALVHQGVLLLKVDLGCPIDPVVWRAFDHADVLLLRHCVYV